MTGNIARSETLDRPGTDADPRQLGLWALFLKFLRFGALAFGGPTAQIAMLRHALVEEERWIDRGRFNRLLAVLQVLPGPEAHELCVHLGMIARGRIGGFLAGLGFMLPGFLLMLIVAWAYSEFIAGNAALAGVLLGMQVVVLAVILRALVRIGQHIVTGRMLAAIAVGAFVLTLAEVPFWLALAAGGLVHAFAHRPLLAGGMLLLTAGIALGVHVLNVPVAPAAPGPEGIATTSAALFIAGLKGGLLTFGGAYTAIPYVRTDTVGRGWLPDATFLDGIALAGVLPAPLVIFATFTGYVAGGLSGALAITAGMFLPAFAFSLILFERLEAIVENPALHCLLEGVAAAVVGIIAATFLDLGGATFARLHSVVPATLLFLAALLMVWRLKGTWVTPALVAGGAIAGCFVLS